MSVSAGMKGKFFISSGRTQRKLDDNLGGYWEFPGGKREESESIEECLAREAMEELGIQIRATKFLIRREHHYPEKVLHLYFHFCEWESGEPQAIDCADFRWIFPEELVNFQFPPADDEIIRDLIGNRQSYFS